MPGTVQCGLCGPCVPRRAASRSWARPKVSSSMIGNGLAVGQRSVVGPVVLSPSPCVQLHLPPGSPMASSHRTLAGSINCARPRGAAAAVLASEPDALRDLCVMVPASAARRIWHISSSSDAISANDGHAAIFVQSLSGSAIPHWPPGSPRCLLSVGPAAATTRPLCEQRDPGRRRHHGHRMSRRIIMRSRVSAIGSMADRCGRSRPISADSGGAGPLRDGRGDGGAPVPLW
jgi:hypothetical protein